MKHREIVFQNVSHCTRFTRGNAQIIIIVLRHDHNPGFRMPASNCPCGCNTIGAFHPDIHDDKVGLLRMVLGYSFVTITRFNETRAQSAKDGLDGLSHVGTVVDNLDEHENG